MKVEGMIVKKIFGKYFMKNVKWIILNEIGGNLHPEKVGEE